MERAERKGHPEAKTAANRHRRERRKKAVGDEDDDHDKVNAHDADDAGEEEGDDDPGMHLDYDCFSAKTYLKVYDTVPYKETFLLTRVAEC